MSALDSLYQAAESYAVSQGQQSPVIKTGADDSGLKSAALAFAKAEGYSTPIPSTVSDYNAVLNKLWDDKVPKPTYNAPKTVTTLTALKSAITNLKPGDDILVQGVTITQQLFMAPKLSSWARITFDHNCVFLGYTGTTWTQLGNLYIPNATYLHLVFQPGCRASNVRGESFAAVFAGSNIIMDGFVAGNNGGGCLHASPVNGDLSYFYARGETFDLGHNVAQWDPHEEKGSGVHAVYAGNGQLHKQHDCLIAIYSHDIKLCGGELQIGTDPASGRGQQPCENMVLLGRFERLHFESRTQTGANGIQPWGAVGKGIVIPYVEAHDIFGKAIWCHNMSTSYKGAPYLSDVKVMAGIATNYCQNPRWKGQSPWDKTTGVTYPNPAALTPKP